MCTVSVSWRIPMLMCRLVLLTENNRRNNKDHGRFGPRIVPCFPEIFFFLLDEHALSPFMMLLSLLVYVGGLHHYVLWRPCIRQIVEWTPRSKATGGHWGELRPASMNSLRTRRKSHLSRSRSEFFNRLGLRHPFILSSQRFHVYSQALY